MKINDSSEMFSRPSRIGRRTKSTRQVVLGLASVIGLLAATGCASPKSVTRVGSAANSDIASDVREPNGAASGNDVDPYIWLENSTDPAVQSWAASRSSKATSALEGDKRFADIAAEARKIVGAKDRIPVVKLEGGKIRNLWNDEQHLRGLWRQTSPESFKTANPDWDILLDVDQLNKSEGKSWVFESANCLAPDADLCLITLSPAGRDEAEIREFDVRTKSFVGSGFNVPIAKTDISWIDTNSVVIGSDFGPGTTTTSGYARQVKVWKRGEPLANAKLLFEGKIDDLSVGGIVTNRPDSNNVYVQEGLSFFTAKQFLVSKSGSLQVLPFPDDAKFEGEFKGRLLATLRSDLNVGSKHIDPGSLISLPLAKAFAPNAMESVEVVFAPSATAIFEGVSFTRDHLLLSTLNNVKGEIWSYTPAARGWSKAKLKVPANGTLTVQAVDSFDKQNRYYVGYETFNVPSSLYSGSVAGSAPKVVKQLSAKFEASDIVFEQFFSKSVDGTKIPYFVVHKKGYKLNGENPTLLYAYGGFEVSETPFYMRTAGKVWLEKGGVWVLANIRGGGEFGPKWHSAVTKMNRQLVYQDFASVATDLMKRKITSARRLGIMGGSNGGLLVGVAETQHPEYYHAVVCESALLDMIRYTKLPPGASWIGEYGDPDDPQMAAYIRTYSPYQNLKPGIAYPKTFFHISTADDRVQPGHTRKMTARMEELGNDVLFFENTEGGHGGAADIEQSIRKAAMEYTFLYQQLMD